MLCPCGLPKNPSPPPPPPNKKKKKIRAGDLTQKRNPEESVDVKKIFPQAEKVPLPISFLMVRPLYVQQGKMSIVFGTGRFTNCLKACQIRNVHVRY